MHSRIVAACIAAALLSCPLTALAQSQAPSASLSGRVLDAGGGLPVQGALVELDANGKEVATTSTDAQGVYSFSEPQGVYSVLIVARGYLSTRVQTVYLAQGSQTRITTVVQQSSNQSTNLKEIGRVVTAASTGQSLQTTTTVNEYVDPSQVQAYSYSHIGSLLARLPGIDMHTSPSIGDDMSISIRGFDPSETATLLDGHPIGPIGAFGGANSPGFDYKLAPFWGLSGTSVIMGSGATGLYGVSTIAGAVNFDTLSPTREAHASLFQGVGNSDHTMSAFEATGSLGKLGYALADGVQGSTGQFPGGNITQSGLMSASAYCNSPGGPTCTSGGNNVQPGDLTSQNQALNTYNVSGAYTQRNTLGKLTYTFSPKTQVLASFFDTDTWNDKSGNGDQDDVSNPFVLNNAKSIISGGNNNFVLNGTPTTCSNTTIAVLNNSSAGYECLTAQQYANAFTGPAGGGPNRWNASHMEDYHARVTQQVGSTQLIVDGFANNYDMDEHKSGVGPFFEDDYLTHGLLVSDEVQLGQHDLSYGYYSQHQRHAFSTNFDGAPSTTNPPYFLGSNSYFVRDQWQNSLQFQTSLDLWEQHSVDTDVNSFDPRLTFIYRPTTKDVIRVTGGRSYSEPDPALLSTLNPSESAPLSVNPAPIGQLTSIGSAGNPLLRPETAIDEELTYGHRFSSRLSFQADAYSTLENNAILQATLPISEFPQYNALLNQTFPGSTTSFLQQYLNRVSAFCACTATPADLGWTTSANAAQALYRGVTFEGTVGIVRNLTLDAQYGLQSAVYKGIPVSTLENNPYLINGVQMNRIPLQKAFGSLVYQNAAGFKLEADETYVGNNNEFARPAFMYTDAVIAKTTGPVTVTFGVTNLFNNDSTQYGEIGLGTYFPQNQYFSSANAVGEGTELYGLLPRQTWLTVTFHV